MPYKYILRVFFCYFLQSCLPFERVATKMAPAIVMIDPTDDSIPLGTNTQRTLLLAPPSLASHPTALSSILSQYERSTTDLQMIDRLSAGLVSLPSATYDKVFVLSDASSTLGETLPLLTRSVLGPVAESLRLKGRLQAQDGTNLETSSLAKEAVLAGLIAGKGGFEKPDYGSEEGTVSLKLSFKKKNKGEAIPVAAVTPVQTNGRSINQDIKPSVPAGVGFIDLSDDLDDEFDDDEIIDEDTLMTEDDLKRPINIRKSLYNINL